RECAGGQRPLLLREERTSDPTRQLEWQGHGGRLARAAGRVPRGSCGGVLGRHEADRRARPHVQWSRSRRCVDQGGLVHVVRRPHCEAAGVVTRMFERRISLLLAALVVFLGSAALWNAFVRPAPRSSPSATPSQPSDSARDNTAPATPTAPASRAAQPPPIDATGP